jgi:hypothetical protein
VREIVAGEQDGDLFLASQRDDALTEVGGGHRVKTCKGLVEQKQAGPMEERPADGQFLPHSLGPTDHPVVAPLPEAEGPQ